MLLRDAVHQRGTPRLIFRHPADGGVPTCLIIGIDRRHQTSGRFDQGWRCRDDDRNAEIETFRGSVSPSLDMRREEAEGSAAIVLDELLIADQPGECDRLEQTRMSLEISEQRLDHPAPAPGADKFRQLDAFFECLLPDPRQQDMVLAHFNSRAIEHERLASLDARGRAHTGSGLVQDGGHRKPIYHRRGDAGLTHMIGERGTNCVGGAKRWRAQAHELLEIGPVAALAGVRAEEIRTQYRDKIVAEEGEITRDSRDRGPVFLREDALADQHKAPFSLSGLARNRLAQAQPSPYPLGQTIGADQQPDRMKIEPASAVGHRPGKVAVGVALAPRVLPHRLESLSQRHASSRPSFGAMRWNLIDRHMLLFKRSKRSKAAGPERHHLHARVGIRQRRVDEKALYPRNACQTPAGWPVRKTGGVDGQYRGGQCRGGQCLGPCDFAIVGPCIKIARLSLSAFGERGCSLCLILHLLRRR
jgi:hypothetical protein